MIYRVKKTSNSRDLSFPRHLFDKSCVFHYKKKLTAFQSDRILDSNKYLESHILIKVHFNYNDLLQCRPTLPDGGLGGITSNM